MAEPSTKDKHADLDDSKSLSEDADLIVTVSYRGSLFRRPFGSGASIGTLRKAIEEELGFPARYQRLILKGKLLPFSESDILLANLKLDESSKIMLVATSAETAEAVKTAEETLEALKFKERERDVVNDFLLTSKVETVVAAPRNWQGREFGFSQVKVLSGLPNQDTALRILEELAADPGVLAVMRKHKWSVGCLAEMYPEGMVGVSEVCVLGLNTNKGESIQLRIRTDDLSGFRKLLNIKQVLYHELAHNVHSEHDGRFNALMRDIARDAAALGVGHSLGGSRRPQHARPRKHAWAGSGVLSSGTDADWQGISAKEMSARAALKRSASTLSVSEPAAGGARGWVFDERAEATNCCVLCGTEIPDPPTDDPTSDLADSLCIDCSSESQNQPHSHASQPLNSEQDEGRPHDDGSKSVPSAPSVPDIVSVEIESSAPLTHVPNRPSNPDGAMEDAAHRRDPPTSISEKRTEFSESTADSSGLPPSKSEELAAVDEAAASTTEDFEWLISMGFPSAHVRSALDRHALSDNRRALALELLLAEGPADTSEGRFASRASSEKEPSGQPTGREVQIAAAAAALVQQGPGAAETADTLIAVISQIMSDPAEPKWRRLRTTNVRFQRLVGRHKHALDFLLAVGFEPESTLSPETLFLKRNDPGLLWLGLSNLQQWRPALA